MGLDIASVYILVEKKIDGVDKIVFLSIAISVFKTLNLFCVAAVKQSLKSAVSKVDTKKKAKRLDIFVAKTRSVGIVIKKWSAKKGDPYVHLVRCLPKSPGKIISEEKNNDKRLLVW